MNIQPLFSVINVLFLHLLTYLLTPWCKVLLEKLTGFAASQEIPRISRNPKVHHLIHKRPPPFPILGQPNPVHIPTSHLLEVHPNIIHPSTLLSPHWFISLRFPTKNLYTPLSSPIRTTCLAHLTRQVLVRLIQYILDLCIVIPTCKVNCKKKSVEEVWLDSIL